MNVVVLQNRHRQVSATHVAVFKVMTTRIKKKNKYNVSGDIRKVCAVLTTSSLTSLDHICIFYVRHSTELIFIWQKSPQWARASSFMSFLDHTHDATQSVGLLWTSDQPFAQTST